MKLLVIEDDADILPFLKSSLTAEGFVVDTADNGKEGVSLAQLNTYDLLILDFNLPDTTGDLICKKLRAQGKHMPILFLTVHSELETKVDLFEAGADDFLSKPFAFKELLARVRALLRRPQVIQSETLKVRDLTLDTHTQQVMLKKKLLYLTRKEFLILAYLLRKKGTVVSKISLLENVWDAEVDLFSNAIETHVLNLRSKLHPTNKSAYIKTISGRGYTIA